MMMSCRVLDGEFLAGPFAKIYSSSDYPDTPAMISATPATFIAGVSNRYYHRQYGNDEWFPDLAAAVINAGER
jgi:hypothetical protein